MKHPTTMRLASITMALVLMPCLLQAMPPFGDPDQPYDRLPGTWETPHVKWLKPLAEGKHKVLFIIPFAESREVVELAQRLDLDYTVIMNAGRSAWARGGGGGGGPEPSTLMGVEADAAIEKVASERLSLAFKYDAIVLAKVSWEVIPEKYRTLILKHVERGAGLTYVSPNRLKSVTDGEEESSQEHGVETGSNEQYEKLFVANENPEVARRIISSLPFDLIPLKVLDSPEGFTGIKDVQRYFSQFYRQVPMCITTSHHGKGRIISIQYFDVELKTRQANSTALTPYIEYDKVMYDYCHALLAKCVRWSAGVDPSHTVSLSIHAPATGLREPVDVEQMKYCHEFKTPGIVIDRKDLAEARIVFAVSTTEEQQHGLRLSYQIRNMAGQSILGAQAVAQASVVLPVTWEIVIPSLARGNYLVDLRVANSRKQVLDSISKSFRVESALQVKSVTTEREYCKPGETIRGQVQFSHPLSDKQRAEVRASDTWGRITAKRPVTLSADRTGGTFEIPVNYPLAGIWDVSGHIVDEQGDVASLKTWVGIPRYEFDDFIVNMTFCEGPGGGGWKGCIGSERLRTFGVNSYLSSIIYQPKNPGEQLERYNMRNLFFADHFGQSGNPKAQRGPFDVEFSESCMSEISRMCRHTADTGELPTDEKFPYKFNFGHYNYTANELQHRITSEYIPSRKFSSPLYILTGESTLSGDQQAQENSCFSPLCTQRFQDWCKQEYNNDLAALNKEWNTAFTAWDQVRGILMNAATEQDQLPRWVDFRYFMRSKVWTQFFIDYTDMIRRFVPGARTGRIGHMHYDYSLFRKHMTSTKIYQAQDANPELNTMVEPELMTSFSDDNSIMIASCGLINWNAQFRTPQTRTRFPWKMFFMGFRGYDMERHLTSSRLGGESWMTPCMSERMPFFKDMSDQAMFLQRGLTKLTVASKPHRSKVAIVWSPRNHFISRLDPFQDNSFTGGHLYNIDVEFGAPHDCLAVLKSIGIRGKFVAPEDIIDGVLEKENYKAVLLPYSKGMSLQEAGAIRKFVQDGGLVVAANNPGTYSQHGRWLEKSRVADLFPVMDKKSIIPFGKGHAAYLHSEINGYLARMKSGDYTGSDTMALLLKKYAGITAPIQLTYENGTPRRDTLMPVYKNGSGTCFGLLRHEASTEAAPTVMTFDKAYHLWDVREQTYLGLVKSATIQLDMIPRFFALLPANLSGMTVTPQTQSVKQGANLEIRGTVAFAGKTRATEALTQAAHIRVFSPKKKELEWFRQNIVFDGEDFQFVLPVSYSEKPGVYSVIVEHTLTGLKARTTFEVTI